MLQTCHKLRNLIRPSFKFKKCHLSSGRSSNNDLLLISDEVKEALHANKGVVALESTIITHGMPFPENFNCAISVESKVRESGSIPATVAVINGVLRVGLSQTELEWLADTNKELYKISRRDLSHLTSQNLSGGTTVSATMIAANMAGIHVFATGGIGGVHRGADSSFDISADLIELSRTPVTVVSSGVKSILDIGKTLEYLETHGVYVATFGESKSFPAFFTRESGFQPPYNLTNAIEAAKVIDSNLHLGLNSGGLIAVPIPMNNEADVVLVQEAINEAVEAARKEKIQGKDVTPFILKRVNESTKGLSLKANVALVENNATVAGCIARELSSLQSSGKRSRTSRVSSNSSSSSSESSKKSSNTSSTRGKRPVVIGGTVVDFMVKINKLDFQMNGDTYPGRITQNRGGVGHNLATCLARLGLDPLFLSVVGDDSFGSSLPAANPTLDFSNVIELKGESTCTYSGYLNATGQLEFGVGDMGINRLFELSMIRDLEEILTDASLLVLDSNFGVEFIQQLLKKCSDNRVPVWFEPTSLQLSGKPFQGDNWRHLSVTSPNLQELVVMWAALMDRTGQSDRVTDEILRLKYNDLDRDSAIEASVTLSRDLLTYIPMILVTIGQYGAVLCHKLANSQNLHTSDLLDPSKHDSFTAKYYPALDDPERIRSVSGAGDCLAACLMHSILTGSDVDLGIRRGMMAANLSLQSLETVPNSISINSLDELLSTDKTSYKIYDLE